MHIVITSATAAEVAVLQSMINDKGGCAHQVDFHISGVGMLLSTFSLTQLLQGPQPDLVIQCGIAGTYTALPLGQTVVVQSEVLGTLGVQEKNAWKDMFDAGFIDKAVFPFDDGKLPNPWLQNLPLDLQKVTGITVDEVTTSAHKIQQLAHKYAGETESMEGAALHYVCLQKNIPFIQFRGISNVVGERDKKHWKIKESLANTAQTVDKYLHNL